jgi:hypothetical protein
VGLRPSARCSFASAAVPAERAGGGARGQRLRPWEQRGRLAAGLRRILLALSSALILAAGLAPGAQAAPGLRLGLSLDPVLVSGSAASRARYYADAVFDGVQVMRVDLTWYQVAPARRPRGFDASNPASPGYNWAATDAIVRALSSHGIQVVMTIWGAPRWAEQGKLGRFARAGTWSPDPLALAQFARAAALRYDGHFPDPLHPGSSLPRVSEWQVWNEPNLAYYLDPQWTRTRHGIEPAAPQMFRAMANAFYAAVKGVSSSNLVVLGGTAPYGNPPGGPRMPPVQFYRYLFCLAGRVALVPQRCPDPVHADAIDHHPYGIGGPLQHAFNPDDAAIPDIYKITRVLHAAERAGHILPRGPKQVWASEFSWDSDPPDPHGVPIQREARWLEQALYVLWRQGVSTAMWLQLVDSPPIPNYASTYQAGLYFLDGKPKPTATAYRFPFVTSRLSSDRVLAWGRAPDTGTVLVQLLRGGRWQTIRRLRASRHSVFETTLPLRGRALLRAVLGAQVSLTWSQS